MEMTLKSAVLLVLCLLLAACGPSQEEKSAYEKVKQDKTAAACQAYLDKWPDGEYGPEVAGLLAQYKKRDEKQQQKLFREFVRKPSLAIVRDYLQRFPKGKYQGIFSRALEQHDAAQKALTSYPEALKYIAANPSGIWISYVRQQVFLRKLVQKYPLKQALANKDWLALDYYLDQNQGKAKALEVQRLIQAKTEKYQAEKKVIQIGNAKEVVVLPRGRQAQGKGHQSISDYKYTRISLKLINIKAPKGITLGIVGSKSKKTSFGYVETDYVYGVSADEKAPLGRHQISAGIRFEYTGTFSSKKVEKPLNFDLDIKDGSVGLEDVYGCYLLAKAMLRQKKKAHEGWKQTVDKVNSLTLEQAAGLGKGPSIADLNKQMDRFQNEAERLANVSASWAQRLASHTKSGDKKLAQIARLYVEAFLLSREQYSFLTVWPKKK
jgi:hypothetical protein